MTENILFVASEAYPLIKTGGLADVVGALPHALEPYDIAATTLLPLYPQLADVAKGAKRVAAYDDLFGGPATILKAKAAAGRLLFLSAPHLYDRSGGPYIDANGYDWDDNWLRFAALGRAGADVARGKVPGYRPSLLHVHDWQAALAPVYLYYEDGPKVPSVLTIHNIAFQGQFNGAYFRYLGLPNRAYAVDGVEYYGGVGFLKAGIRFADAITTVSPTYAREICTHEFGMGLEGLIAGRRADLHGILNGIDIDDWNPEIDDMLAAPFSARSPAKRTVSKREIEKEFNLAPSDAPLFGVVARLTWQKGMDILADAVDGVLATGARLVVLGSGDASIEARFRAEAERHYGNIGVKIDYDERLARLIQGGADSILVPSRFEPCGLTQLYALHYGAPPIVTRTGGLADTVIDANEAALDAGVATGFVMARPDVGSLIDAVARAGALYRDKGAWKKLQRNGMKADVSWRRSAERYVDLYQSLMEEAAG